MSQSFKETTTKKRVDGKRYDCETCGLFKSCISPRMEPYGKFEKGIMVIGEAPGESEDEQGMPWQGRAGKLLQRFLRKQGIDLFNDCVSLNAVNCRPNNNRTPTNTEITCCRNMIVSNAIEHYMPTVIIPLGTSAMQSVIGDRWKRDLQGITRWRGFQIPDRDLKCWVAPTYHPSYMLRMDDGRADVTWVNDLKGAIALTAKPLPEKPEVRIEIIDNLDPLDKIKSDLIAIDYETTGLKPYAMGHRIVCAAVAYDEVNVKAFMMPPTPKARAPFYRLLTNGLIGKMAHNIKFEDTWTNVRLNVQVANWSWDSMLAAHMLDNRSGVSGLKFQTYVNFGIIDYDGDIYPYLIGSDYKNANSFNRVQELVDGSWLETKDHYERMAHGADEGSYKLMQYCALDAVYEYRLALKQIDIMDYSFLPF